jgi:hypothetical protein
MSGMTSRVVLGFVAGALSVLTFQQGMIGMLHATHVIDWGAYPMSGVPPLGVPRVLDLAFWGGAWGVLFALVAPRLPGSDWLKGIGLGIAANLVAWFVIPPLRGQPVVHSSTAIELGLIINCFWGFGVGLILPSLVWRGRMARA